MFADGELPLWSVLSRARVKLLPGWADSSRSVLNWGPSKPFHTRNWAAAARHNARRRCNDGRHAAGALDVYHLRAVVCEAAAPAPTVCGEVENTGCRRGRPGARDFVLIVWLLTRERRDLRRSTEVPPRIASCARPDARGARARSKLAGDGPFVDRNRATDLGCSIDAVLALLVMDVVVLAWTSPHEMPQTARDGSIPGRCWRHQARDGVTHDCRWASDMKRLVLAFLVVELAGYSSSIHLIRLFHTLGRSSASRRSYLPSAVGSCRGGWRLALACMPVWRYIVEP